MDRKHAFTMLELMVVVVIVGIIATFAIPNYTKSVDQSYEKDAVNNLTLIAAAQQFYFTNNNQYLAAGANRNTINSALKLNILPNGFTYSCPSGGASYDCRATRVSGTNPFELKVTDTVPTPCCSVATCPTVAGC
jgi:prepilin-type N-terminal cleavage/methylation domain-containing protein